MPRPTPPTASDHPIARYRFAKKLSLRAFAKHVPMTCATLWQLEKGNRGPPRPELVRRMSLATHGVVSEDAILMWHHNRALENAA